LAGVDTWGSTLSGSGLHPLNDLFATRSSFVEFGLDTSLAQVCSLLGLIDQSLAPLLDLSVVGTGLLSWILTLGGSSGELLFDLRLFRVQSLLLLLDLGLLLCSGQFVVSLGTKLDRAQELGLTLLSTGKLLLEGALDTLDEDTLLRITALANELDFPVVSAGTLLDLGQLAVVISLSLSLLLAKHIADALALGTLK